MKDRLWRLVRTALLASVVAHSAGCVTAPIEPMDYSALLHARPRSVVIVPVLNNSHEVAADEIFLATITLPVAERGYYVFPVNLTRELLYEAGLADPGLVHKADAKSIGRLFGADAVLYVQIDHWEAKYAVLTTTVDVEMRYELRSGATGGTLWSAHRKIRYRPTTQSSGIAALIEMVVEAAMAKAMPNYIPLARQANHIAIGNVLTNRNGVIVQDFANPYFVMSAGTSAGGQVTTGETNLGKVLLFGPYHPLYGTDDPATVAEAEAAEK